MTFDLMQILLTLLTIPGIVLGAFTLSLRHKTQAVIFLVISGTFLSPNASRSAVAADGADGADIAGGVLNGHSTHTPQFLFEMIG